MYSRRAQQSCRLAPAWLHLGVSNGRTRDLSTTIVAGDCISVTVSNVRLNGVALDPAATYQVTVNNFLADGGDNVSTFATIDPSLRVDGGNDLGALVNYFVALSPVAPPSTDPPQRELSVSPSEDPSCNLGCEHGVGCSLVAYPNSWSLQRR